MRSIASNHTQHTVISSNTNLQQANRHGESKMIGRLAASRLIRWTTGLTAVGASASALLYLRVRDDLRLLGIVQAESPPRTLSLPWSTIAKQRRVEDDLSTPPFRITLFQYETCPYCSKVRAFLDYYGVAYETVEVNPLFRSQLKRHTPGNRRVPFVVVSSRSDPDRRVELTESSLIISMLRTLMLGRFEPSDDANDEIGSTFGELKRFYPAYTEPILDEDGQERYRWWSKVPLERSGFRNKYYLLYGSDSVAMPKTEAAVAAYREEIRWREWVDENFVHVLAPNIYRTLPESIRTFRYLSDRGQWEEQFSSSLERHLVVYVGATIMWAIAKRIRKRHDIDKDVRSAMYAHINTWLRRRGPDRLFLGGSTPNLADLAAYGVLSAIEGTDAFRDARANTDIDAWYEATKARCADEEGSELVHWARPAGKAAARSRFA